MSLTKVPSSMLLGAPVNVFDFGVVGDGVTDDSAAIQAAANFCVANNRSLYAPPGYTIKLSSAVDLRNIKYITFSADILVSPAIVAVPVTVGGFSTQIGGAWLFNDVSDGSSVTSGTPPTRPIFRVYGSKAVDIQLGNCQYMQLYSNAANATGTSNAYNNIFLHGAVYKVELFGAPGLSWVNENFFYGGRIQKLTIDGTNYGHNHNKFFNNCFEGNVDIQFIGPVSTNTIYGARFEDVAASPGVTFSASSYSNYVIQSWSGAGSPYPQFRPSIPVVDNGQGNMVTTEAAYTFNKTIAFDVSPASVILSTNTAACAIDLAVGRNYYAPFLPPALTPSLNGFSGDNFSFVALSDYIPVKLGDVIGFNLSSPTSVGRWLVYPYDDKMRGFSSETGGSYISMPDSSFSVTDNRGVYLPAANMPSGSAYGAVVRSEVKYVQLGLIAGSGGGFFNSAQGFVYSQSYARAETEGRASMRNSLPALNGTPTKGYAPKGHTVLDTSVSPPPVRYVSFSYETNTTALLAAGATSVTVVNPGSIANGDVVGILLDSGLTHWTTVSSLSGSTFTIAAVPAGQTAAAGNRIVFNRWV